MTPRLHYRHLALDYIDEQIRQLRERRADISIEIQRIAMRENGIPVLKQIERKCREVSDEVTRLGN